MRLLILLLVLAAPGALAQSESDARSPRTPEARPWRVAASGGLHAALGTAVAVSADKSVLGPLALGVRTTAFGGGGIPVDDGGGQTGATGDVYLALQTTGRVRFRLIGGLGLGILDGYSGGLPCEPEFGACTGSQGFSGLYTYSIVGLGTDLHITRAVAIGAEYRVDPSFSGPNASTLDAGLRLRF